MAVGHLHLEVKGSAVVFLHISGEPEWCWPSHLLGPIHPNAHLAFGFINELDSNQRSSYDVKTGGLNAIPRWTHATLSVGGFRCKSDIRATSLNGTGCICSTVRYCPHARRYPT